MQQNSPANRLINPLKGIGVNWLAVLTLCRPCRSNVGYIYNFWHSGTLALSPERQSARMSEITNVR